MNSQSCNNWHIAQASAIQPKNIVMNEFRSVLAHNGLNLIDIYIIWYETFVIRSYRRDNENQFDCVDLTVMWWTVIPTIKMFQ